MKTGDLQGTRQVHGIQDRLCLLQKIIEIQKVLEAMRQQDQGGVSGLGGHPHQSTQLSAQQLQYLRGIFRQSHRVMNLPLYMHAFGKRAQVQPDNGPLQPPDCVVNKQACGIRRSGRGD
ncbi:hypothetical protein D3C72_1696940 [compost metagenome]